MLLKAKVSKFVSVLALSGLLASCLTTSSWGMREDSFDWPIEAVIPIVRIASKEIVNLSIIGSMEITNFELLYKCRLISTLWKEATEEVIIKDKLLHIALSPINYSNLILKDIAPLFTTIDLAGWDENNSDQIEVALSNCDFSNVSEFQCMKSGSIENVSKNIGEKGVISLASGLKKLTTLKRINLTAADSINEEGGKALGESIQTLSNLQTILISDGMDPHETVHFAEGLNHLELERLYLYGNIGDIGCRTIANRLKHLPSLKVLCMRSKYITQSGKEYFMEMVKEYNPNLDYSLDYIF